MGNFRIDWYIIEADLRYQNYWFAADIMTDTLIKRTKALIFPPLGHHKFCDKNCLVWSTITCMVYLFVNKHAWFHMGRNLSRKVLILMKFKSGNACKL